MRMRYVVELFLNNLRKKNVFFLDCREKNCFFFLVVKRKNMYKVYVVYVEGEGEGKNNVWFLFYLFFLI